ncbi:MAG: hypothetical protein LBP28_07055 [Coriobacteriales bacterium]|jgi:Na+/proline symporter|nr:hypothetical protein [Coriobacteriales bacterium]
MNDAIGVFFWVFLVIYGIGMFVISPKAKNGAQFFRGKDRHGRDVRPFVLTASIFVSWIMAKSVTNCINLGAQYGLVGGVAYAAYWLAIPLAGLVIYRLRKTFGIRSIVGFLTTNYGRAAAAAFSLAILIRLFNEIWSNSSVVAGYYGAPESLAFIVSAVLFTLIALAYSIKGGMRSSLFTDAVQFIMFLMVMFFLLFLVLPGRPLGEYLGSGVWSLETGVDLLLVTCLQIFSYPFHDPVLTDRAFISKIGSMLKVYIVSGIIGFAAILLFSLIGIDATLSGMALTGNMPVQIAQAMGGAGYIAIALIMILAAGSTLDSTFTSLAKLAARDMPLLRQKDFGEKARRIGIVVMFLFAILGNIPMVLGTNVLLATTISGTMVMGMGPVFCLYGLVKPTKLGFHLSFWIGIGFGIAHTLGLTAALAIGTGPSAALLGANLYGLILCTLGYLLPGLLAGARDGQWRQKLPRAGDYTEEDYSDFEGAQEPGPALQPRTPELSG